MTTEAITRLAEFEQRRAASALAAQLAAFDPSDTGNAKRLLARFGDDLLFPTHAGWHVWDGRRFLRDDRRDAVKLAQETAGAIFQECPHIGDPEAQKKRGKWAIDSQNRSRVAGMLEMAAPHRAVAPDALDADPMLLNVENGTLDLRTGKLRAHDRADRITKLAPVEFDPDAPCPQWERFLAEVFDGDADLIGFMQRAIGYSLSGDTREHCLFILHGVGSNGKSTLVETIAAMLGDYAQQTPTETFMAKDRSGGIPNDIARLKGARFVSAVESESDRRLAESLVKQATGGDRLAARFLYQETFDFRPAFKLWLATNHKPEVRGTDEGIWRRIRLVPFEVQFVDPDKADGRQPVKDREMPARLLTELPGILAWAVRGCLEWQRDGLSPPAKVLQATEDYRVEMDVLSDFIAERCIVNPNVNAQAKDLYAAYSEWCAANGVAPLNSTRFGRALADRGHRKEKSNLIVYRGITVRDASTASRKGEAA